MFLIMGVSLYTSRLILDILGIEDFFHHYSLRRNSRTLVFLYLFKTTTRTRDLGFLGLPNLDYKYCY